MDIVSFPFMKKNREFFFTNKPCQSVGSRYISGCKRSQRSSIQIVNIPVICDLLTIFINEKYHFGIRFVLEFLQDPADLLKLLLIHDHVSAGHKTPLLRLLRMEQ